MKSYFLEIHGKRNYVIHRSCADSNVPVIPQDQYALMQESFTMSNLMNLYMFLIATKDNFCFHGNQWHNFNSDSTCDKLPHICFNLTYIFEIGIKLKFIQQPLSLYQKMQASKHFISSSQINMTYEK